MSRRTLPKAGVDVLAIFLLSMLSAMPATAETQEKAEPWVDRDRYPEAYSILTSDHIMFPDNTTNWPLKIDSKRQLFVDDYMVSSMENLTRQYHQPVKHPKNPLVVADRPWESEIPEWIYLGSVLYDPITSKFQMFGLWIAISC